MNTTFVKKILKSLMNHTKGSGNVENMIKESTEKINKIKLTEEEKKYITKKYSDYVNIIKHSINESTDEKFQNQVSKKRKFIHTVVDSLVRESKLIWTPSKLVFHVDDGWMDVRVAVPFNSAPYTLSEYFRGEGRHQQVFKLAVENFVQDIYGLSKGETYYVYNLYLKEMYTKISNFIKENTIDDEPNENTFAINEENIFKKYARKAFNKLVGQKNVNEKFIEKMVKFVEGRWDEVINVTWSYDVWGEIILTVYIDEHDNQPLTQHPLQDEIFRTLLREWKLSSGKTFLLFKVNVINLNKDTDYSGIKSEINEENIFKKYGRKLYSKFSDTPHVSERFVEKMAKFIEGRYDEVINVTWTYDISQKIELKVYIDEDDGHRTDIGVHPLETKIRDELYKDWHLAMHKDSHLWLYIKVINLNKDTKLRSSVKESINEDFNNYDETIPNERFRNYIDKVVKRMVEKTDINLYASDYDPWTTSSPWFGNFITPQFPNDKRYKFNITWLLDEHFERMSSFIKYFANELIEAYAFSTRGQLEYFDSEYLKKLKEKVETLKIPLIEKRRKQKEEYNKKYNIWESKKDVKKEEDEIQRAVQDLSRLHNFNTSVSELTRGIVDSTPQPLSSEIWEVLENTESNEIEEGDFDSVFRLAQKYGKSNPLKLIKKLKKETYNPPIIVRYEDKYRLVAGNTRLCTASALGITPNVLIIDLNKPFPVENFTNPKKPLIS